jgi:hypothetical protein
MCSTNLIVVLFIIVQIASQTLIVVMVYLLVAQLIVAYSAPKTLFVHHHIHYAFLNAVLVANSTLNAHRTHLFV